MPPPLQLEDGLSNILALQPWEGTTSFWRLLPEEYLLSFATTVNHPEWLADIIKAGDISTRIIIKTINLLK